MNVRAILRSAQYDYLRHRDPALATVADADLLAVSQARVQLGVAPLDLADCQVELDFAELADAVRFFLANSDLGCPRKEMAMIAAASILDEQAKVWGMHPSQRTIPPAEGCRQCPQTSKSGVG